MGTKLSFGFCGIRVPRMRPKRTAQQAEEARLVWMAHSPAQLCIDEEVVMKWLLLVQ